jgi:hypothetical protein
MAVAVGQLNVRQLRFILSQIPASEDDRVLDVFMPYYKRTFPLVAYDELKNIEGQPVTDQSPMVLITGPKPK